MCEKKSCVEVLVGSVVYGFFFFIGFIFYIVFLYCFIVKYVLVNCIINKYWIENIKLFFCKLFNNKCRCLFSLFNFFLFGFCDV